MKKFNFSLSTVHKYKNQILDNLKSQHATILAALKDQENILLKLEDKHKNINNEFNSKNKQGLILIEAIGYKRYLKILENKIKEEKDKLNSLKETESEKKTQVIEARKEVASLDKLKEKRLDEYNKALQKKEEQSVEEFVSNRFTCN
ncbi:flagellar export protein FliJ [Anaerovorax odorimutans]|uniref:flagellar export protein FliJ n=1 Tax=Anaerovorax odorimutans TaxID=109327 RepID=UPI0004161D2C|nr:flagellar export protein FliJ [Anaerovorax odorimutans]